MARYPPRAQGWHDARNQQQGWLGMRREPDPHRVFRDVKRPERREYARMMRGTLSVQCRDLGRAYDRFILTLLRDLLRR